MFSPAEKAELIRQKAIELGFSSIGFATARRLDDEAQKLETWLSKGHHGTMSYMENYFDMRVDPTKLVDGAKTVISLSYNYYNPDKQSDPEAPKISMYAYGRDYHKVVKKKLKTLYNYIKEQWGEIPGRCFVDSAPILERDWAKLSGLGWVGKHTLLVNPKQGSYFFLAEIILDLELESTTSIKDHCGTCTRCIDACPTDAISPEGYILDGSKCISFLTIELRDNIPEEYKDKMKGWAYGCDICQDVCPWNRFAKRHNEMEFESHPDLIGMKQRDWEEITEEVFNTMLKHTPMSRVKYEGLKRNIRFLKKDPV